MKRAALVLALAVVFPVAAHAQSAHVRSAPYRARGAYGTNFGNRYQYFGLGYGYQNWQGAWKPYSYGMGGRRGGGYGGGGGMYSSGMNPDMQLQLLHERQMMWTMQWAPIPEMPPVVNFNSRWNPYQSRLADEYYRPRDPAPHPETVFNPFVKPHPAK